MTTTRQDAWTKDEDLLLAEVVLRSIREGGTQLQAFEKVGKELSRTAAACGFRWNSYVRKQYRSGIELAKKQRKQLKHQPRIKTEVTISTREDKAEKEGLLLKNKEAKPLSIDLEDLIQVLKKLYDQASEKEKHGESVQQFLEKNQLLEKKIYELTVENEKLEKALSTIQQDYRELMKIMDRARQFVEHKED
ncbi:RsfA family transcriptional regulator [Bacillaceae bacterium Marseille-Q3522]|nr:RsfA family transcriptional regulator [Bacillaceae bacterium Marseille-Q3522]